MLNKVTASDIDSWAKANPRRAQEVLPELIIRLILATSKKIKNFNFPFEQGIQFSGYDGVLESNEQTNFFPEGKSVWEFGIDKDAIGKFRGDIDKRFNNPLGVNIQNTVFIFATLKIWNHRISIEELLNESKAKYSWKDIYIIDAFKIALWLEHCSGVSLWMCKIIGKPVKGMLSVEQYWEEYCHSTTPNLTGEFFLFSREEQVKCLSGWLEVESGHGYRVLISESSFESALFVAAAIISLSESDDNALKGIKSKIIIVTSPDTWNNLMAIADNGDRIIFVPIFNFTEDIRCPKSISAILPISKYSPSSRITKNITKIELPIRIKNVFSETLELLGYTSDDSSRIEAATKRSFLSLYRMITNIPIRKQPKWTTEKNLRELVPALLLGGWNAKYTGDKKIIEKISGISYEKYVENLNKWITIEDAPLFTVLDSFQIASIQDAWNFLFDKLVSTDIEKLKDCIIDIFGTTNPTFELPREQWFMASVLGKNHEYSTSLQHGIVISLIMLAERHSEENSFGIISTRLCRQ